MASSSFNEVDILYTLMSYVNVSSTQDMYYTIAHTVLTHLDLIPDISINDLADLCYTSPATISRFCKDLNCKNFANFKHEMAIALEIAENEIHIEPHIVDEIQKEPQYLVDMMHKELIESLTMGYQTTDIRKIDKMCEFIHNTDKIHMVGYQFNKIISNDFQMKMLKLKKFVYAFVDRGEDIQRLDMLDKETLVIILSVRARAQYIEPLLEMIQEYHPKVILMTMNKEYKNEKLDFIYYVDGTESQYTESSIQGTINFLSVLNLIYVRYGLLYRK